MGIALASHFLHLVTAGLLIGGQAGLLLVSSMPRRAGFTDAAAATLHARGRILIGWTIIATTLSGAGELWSAMVSPLILIATPFGRVLLVKLLLTLLYSAFLQWGPHPRPESGRDTTTIWADTLRMAMVITLVGVAIRLRLS